MQEKRPPLHLVLILLFLALLAYIAVSDLRDFRIPDHATIPLALGGLTWAMIMSVVVVNVVSAIAVTFIFLILGATYKRIRHVEGLGLGDVKLAAAGALWIGPQITLAIVIGAGIALLVTAYRLWAGQTTSDAPIPFGAYLSLGIGTLFIVS